MSLLEDVKQIILDNNVPDGVVTGDIFLGSIPSGEDGDIIALFRSAGSVPSMIGDTRSPNVQLTTRSKSSLTATETIEVISAVLTAIGNEQKDIAPEGVLVNGTFYLRFQPQQDIFPLGQKDEQGRYIFTQNFIATFFNN